ncbi:MAG TPA: hypothetical protein VHO90_18320, partial [Bacteroidales bacterium]|nr:hypothetical protein [Bacteroidales bacterium]
DIYLDGKLHRSIDSYFFYANQELYDMCLWHAFKLNQGKHTVKVVIKGEKRPESQGTVLYVSKALVFKPAEKSLLANK